MKNTIFYFLSALVLTLASCSPKTAMYVNSTYLEEHPESIPLSIDGFFIETKDSLSTIVNENGEPYIPYSKWSYTDNQQGMVVYYNTEDGSSGWYDKENIHTRLLNCDIGTDQFMFVHGVQDRILIIMTEDGKYGLLDTKKRSNDNFTVSRVDRIKQRGEILAEPIYKAYKIEKDKVVFTTWSDLQGHVLNKEHKKEIKLSNL